MWVTLACYVEGLCVLWKKGWVLLLRLILVNKGLGVVIWMCLLYSCVELIPISELPFTMLLFFTSCTKLLIDILKRYFFSRIFTISQISLTSQITTILISSIAWLLLLKIIVSMLWVLLHKIVGDGVRMVPTLILKLLITFFFLMFGSHLIHGPIFENILRQWFVCLCFGLLLEMLILWVAYIG